MEKEANIIKLKHKDGIVLLNEKKYHLYFTNDDKIKGGDWYISGLTGNILQLSDNESSFKSDKKIIATTDKSLKSNISPYLFKNGGACKSKNFYLPQPSQAFIQKYCEQGGIDKVLVEYEKEINYIAYYDEDNCKPIFKIKTNSHNTITIKRLKDSYTREEVESLLFQYAEDEHAWFSCKSEIDSFNNWIKKNL